MLVDDVGSFPLPKGLSRELFNDAYAKARQGSESILSSVVIDSFRLKLTAGLDVVTYPQQYDMHKQILDSVHEAEQKGTYLVDRERAVLPEVSIIKAEAKSLSEQYGRPIRLRVCVAGPLELYLQAIGWKYQEEVMMMFAETVRRFLENSIIKSKYIETAVVCIDEPCFGFLEPLMETDAIVATLEKACNLNGVIRQIHLHSPARLHDIINVKNIDVLSFEFAASPKNIDAVPKRMLEDGDKKIRVGITRTDIDAVEPVDVIRKRFRIAKEKYGDQMTFVGPDCGLGCCASQESAALLLENTVRAVRNEITS